jgi:[ribosomal protein S5]-alanine N-acetyltransferase
MPSPIVTTRLQLVPSTAAHVRSEIGDRAEFIRLIGADVPDNWPPENIVDALPLFLNWLEAAPDHAGWFGWYALTNSAHASCLIGSGGFLGPPQNGVVSIGYSVLPQFQLHGFATEMAGGLIQWAFANPTVTTIAAETEWTNAASVRVLAKLGFSEAGASANGLGTRFELSRKTLSQP